MRVCHMSNCHAPNDTRIFLKECLSLVRAGHEVYLVVQGEDKEVDGVKVIGCGPQPDSRKQRMGEFANTVYQRALALDCDVYHFHDPELLPYGLKLKKAGKKVVFDSHEDVPIQIMDKHWIPIALRSIVSRAYRTYETHVVSKLDAVVAATPHIGEQFANRAQRVVVVNNYPRSDDIEFQNRSFRDRDPIACYAGAITEKRGEGMMVESMRGVEGELVLAGDHDDESGVMLEKPENVTYAGYLNREEINELYGRAMCGLVVLQPTTAYLDSLPIKLFEYMAAGLPFVASDFPFWQSILSQYKCGFFVDPLNVYEIREGITWLLSHPEEAQSMGERGRKAVEQEFNWEQEERKLVRLYEGLGIA